MKDNEAVRRTLIFLRRFRGWFDDRSGQATTEYILVVGLIAIPMGIAISELKEVLVELAASLLTLYEGPGA